MRRAADKGEVDDDVDTGVYRASFTQPSRDAPGTRRRVCAARRAIWSQRASSAARSRTKEAKEVRSAGRSRLCRVARGDRRIRRWPSLRTPRPKPQRSRSPGKPPSRVFPPRRAHGWRCHGPRRSATTRPIAAVHLLDKQSREPRTSPGGPALVLPRRAGRPPGG
jgi:hypothetical protein